MLFLAFIAGLNAAETETEDVNHLFWLVPNTSSDANFFQEFFLLETNNLRLNILIAFFIIILLQRTVPFLSYASKLPAPAGNIVTQLETAIATI